MNPIYLQVVLAVPLAQFFDYLPPHGVDVATLKPGIRIKVPFGRRELVGVLVGVSEKTTCQPDQLKRAIAVVDVAPILDASLLKLYRKASDYYHCPLGEVVVGTLPKWVRQGRTLVDAPAFTADLSCSAVLSLTAAQQVAVNAVNASKGFKPFLLMGVTGSGKTEVYLQCIEKILRAGKQVLILVPEIGLTPQTLQRFESRFNTKVCLLHSNLTDKQRFAAWCNAKSSHAPIIIGTRSAVFAPFTNLGMIVVDEEHDSSFKQQTGFRYSARDLAVWRAQLHDIPIILGSATPSLESLHNALTEKYILLTLPAAVGQQAKSTLQLIDLKQKKLCAGLSETLLNSLQTHLSAGNQVLVFLNRRGFAPILLCHDCGFMLSCKRCDARLTFHHKINQLVCHHCDARQALPRICPECHQAELIAVGQGTERIEAELTTRFAHVNLLRLDRDTTRKKDSFENMLAQIQSGEAQLLIGTQMLAKGHHFPNLTCVAIVDVDGGLFSTDFRASEKMAQLIVQVAGRAGREALPGEVILQTHLPQHPLLQTLLQQGYLAFAKTALIERRDAQLPPFSHLALLKAEATKQHLPADFLQQAKRVLQNKTIHCLGPVPANMEKKAGKFRSHLLLQANSRSALQKILKAKTAQLADLPEAKRVRWIVDVDPLEV